MDEVVLENKSFEWTYMERHGCLRLRQKHMGWSYILCSAKTSFFLAQALLISARYTLCNVSATFCLV